jgi:hypothetical protein
MNFARAAHDWEVDIFALFFRVYYSARVRQGSEDSCSGSPSEEGCLKSLPWITSGKQQSLW